MSFQRRAAIQRLASNAEKQGVEVVQGIVENSAEGWKIGAYSLDKWLQAHAGQEIITFLGALNDGISAEFTPAPAIHDTARTCLKCGRDYYDTECPHCRQQRERIRGR